MSNRMSAAGIPMFYGALDDNTALLDTFDPARREGKRITIATFRHVRALRLLNLTMPPEMPSIFDPDNRHLRRPIAVIRDFIADFTRPVERDGREHVEYVPTQVVTEFIRHRMRDPDDQVIDGIQYQSSRQGGGTSLVLFFDSRGCGPREDLQAWEPAPVLMLDGHRVIDPSDIAGLWQP